MFTKILLFVVSVMVFNAAACAQKLVDITDKKDVLIDIERIGKPGKTKIYLVSTGDKQIEPPLPNTLQKIENKYYKIETDVIAYGQTIFTFNVPTTQEDFKKVRILRLLPEELNPNGFVWQDCTVTSDRLGNPADENYSAKASERLKKFLSDFAQKTVSCELEVGMKSEEFFVVALQLKPPPTEPFTKITWALESKNLPSEKGGVKYQLTFTNAGTKNIAEFNFRSIFDTDTKLNSFKLSQGTCRNSTYGSSIGSVVCHVGEISIGKSVTLELEGENSGLGGNSPSSDKKNENWDIQGYFKETPNDPLWTVNAIWFKPISKTDLFKK
jgi:hypothetical protein